MSVIIVFRIIATLIYIAIGIIIGSFIPTSVDDRLPMRFLLGILLETAFFAVFLMIYYIFSQIIV